MRGKVEVHHAQQVSALNLPSFLSLSPTHSLFHTLTMSAPIRISYNTLRSDPTSLKDAIQAGLGSQPGALGVVIIEGESGLPPSSVGSSS
jgi:hypothetical protein